MSRSSGLSMPKACVMASKAEVSPGGTQLPAVKPPSTTKAWPVMKEASSLARKQAALAMSSGSPARGTGCICWSSGRTAAA